MDHEARIFVAGHRGMVGSALVRRLGREEGVSIVTRSRAEVDLMRQDQVEQFLGDEHIDQVYLAAARVGGIEANHRFPADFIYQNLLMTCNVIHGAHEAGIDRLLFLGSSCIYPRDAAQPMREEALLTGPLELTNEPYAVAKIAGIKLCESYQRQHGRDYRSVMPTNLYGPNDNFDLQTSHVLPALLRKAHQARLEGLPAMDVWGSGSPRREFLHVDDLADACVHVMQLGRKTYWAAVDERCSHVNVGVGEDISIRALAELCAEVAGFRGELRFDVSKPDGTPRKLLDVGRLKGLGWRPRISLREGVSSTLDWMKTRWADIAD